MQIERAGEEMPGQEMLQDVSAKVGFQNIMHDRKYISEIFFEEKKPTLILSEDWQQCLFALGIINLVIYSH